MKLKVIIFTLFIFFNLVVYIITELNKEQRISKALEIQLNQLKTDYETLLYHQKISNKAILKNIQLISNDVLEQINSTSSHEELTILRKELYKRIYDRYLLIKKQGVYQLHFVLPNNRTFLRIHKPERYGDDLSKNRYSHKYVNLNKKSIDGFEGGKTTHAYRYVYPLFGSNQKYLGSMEISYSSDYLQNYLTSISKHHTHFIVHNSVFSKKVWGKKQQQEQYKQAIEHTDYKFAFTKQHTIERCLVDNDIKLEEHKQYIEEKMKLKSPFSIYTTHDDTIHKEHNHTFEINADVVSFYPIKSTTQENEAWIVSYKESDFIALTLLGSYIIRAISFFSILILLYFVYRNIKQKELLMIKTSQLTDFINSTTDFVWEVDKNGKYTYLSAGVENILGYTSIEMLGKTPFDFIDKHDVKELLESFADIVKQEKPIKDFINNNISKNGKKVCLLTNGVPFYSNGELIGYRGTDKDITTQVEQRNLINQQSKNASMGEMIGNIAHQWRQPLSVISTGASGMLLSKRFNKLSDEQFVETCKLIDDNAQFLSRTIDDFKNFIKDERKVEKFNLTETIDSFLNLVHPSIKRYNIQLILDLDNSIELNGSSNELIQCFMNILNNAKDAFKDTSLENQYIFISSYKNKGKAVIQFKDNAGGIPNKILPRIFEPYFTTKHQSQGTGLGLHMTFNLITSGMHGNITAENTTFEYHDNVYNGAVFTIQLPLK